MKNKIFILIIGMLIGAIIASSGFLIFGGKKSKNDFDPSKFKDGNMTPPNMTRDKGDFDPNNIPEKPAES